MLVILVALYFILPLHPIYLLISIPATVYFLLKAILFALKPERSKARRMYKLASIKLGLIFLAILIAKMF